MVSIKVLTTSLVILTHSWYPSACCSGNEEHGDCRPVPCEELISHEDGTVNYKGVLFNSNQRKASQDGMCHVCIGGENMMEYPHCVFFPAGS